jgi:hypothetical protein
MTIKVIGAGFGRTGTLSLKTALEELGFGPCYHMTELFDNPNHAVFWDAASRRETTDWEQVLGGYRAVVDWPGLVFYKELIWAYPDAKVILTVREPERWYKSAYNTIYSMANGKILSAYLVSVGQLFSPTLRLTTRMVKRTIWEGTFGGRFEDKGHAISVFDRHAKEVKRHVPDEKLLVYEVREGWGPLGEFLGARAPAKPFPHLNERAVFLKMIRRRFAVPVGGSLVAALALLYTLLRVRSG